MYSLTYENSKSNIKNLKFIADTYSDLATIPAEELSFGALCKVIETGDIYKLNSNGEWIRQLDNRGGSNLPSQTGHSGEFLTTDGTDLSWSSIVSTDYDVIFESKDGVLSVKKGTLASVAEKVGKAEPCSMVLLEYITPPISQDPLHYTYVQIHHASSIITNDYNPQPNLIIIFNDVTTSLRISWDTNVLDLDYLPFIESYFEKNPALTASNGEFVWELSYSASVALKLKTIQVFENQTGKLVNKDVDIILKVGTYGSQSGSKNKIIIPDTDNLGTLPAGTYVCYIL